MVLDDGCVRRETKLDSPGLFDLQKRCGPGWIRGSDAGMVPNWLGSGNGSGIKSSASACCGLRGCLAPQATLAMLDIMLLIKGNQEIRNNESVPGPSTQESRIAVGLASNQK